MMTSDEARILVEYSKTKIIEERMKEIYATIRNAAHNGKNTAIITIDNEHKTEIISRLEREGYAVVHRIIVFYSVFW